MNQPSTVTVTVTTTVPAKNGLAQKRLKQQPTPSVCSFQTNSVFGINYFGGWPANASQACQQFGGSLLHVRPSQLADIQAVMANCNMENGVFAASFNNIRAASCLSMSQSGDAVFYNEIDYCSQPQDALCYLNTQPSPSVANELIVSTSTIVTTQPTTSTLTIMVGTTFRTVTVFQSTSVSSQVIVSTVLTVSSPPNTTQVVPTVVVAVNTAVALVTAVSQTPGIAVTQTTRTTNRFTGTVISTAYLSTVSPTQALWNLTC